MTVSNKQISIAIIVLFFAGILGYFLFWFGYVEIFINHAEVENFTVVSREKTYECKENPCRLKVRAGTKFFAKIQNDLAENKTISIPSIPFLKTQKIIIQAKKEIAKAEIQKISRDSLQKNWPYPTKNNFGPVLVSENNKFAIFSRYFAGELKIFITNGHSSDQLLTSIQDEFLSVFLEKNFSLTENGIVIPAKNRVYYYDFATQRKFIILEMNSLRISDISVSNNGKEVVFYNIKEKVWQKYSLNSQEFKNINEVNFAGFWKDDYLEIRDNIVYINKQKSREIPLEISASDKFSIRGNSLIIEQDFEIWEINL